MKVTLFSSLLVFALLVAGCGGSGGGKVDSSDVAVVGTAHITQAMYNAALAQEKASLKASGQALPAVGSTQYSALRTAIIDRLIQESEFASEAEKLGLSVNSKEVETALTKLKKQYFSGDEKKYKVGLKQQGFTDAQVRANLKEKLLEQKLYKSVTKGKSATPAQIAAYYAANISQYQQPASRPVQEILVGKNKEALAQQIYNQLKGGATFTALAKKYSKDPGSKNSGGKFTARNGSDVPEFDKAVFDPASKTGVLLKPVKTAQYGWFVIMPTGAIVAAKTTPQKTAAKAIRKQLDATQKQQAANDWANGVAKDFCSGGKIKYQTGFEPSPDPCAALASNATTT